MENLLSIAVWIVSLSAGLQANPIHQSLMNFNDFDITPLEELACENDSTFYTPTNVKEECLTDALQCYMEELNVTSTECNAKDTIDDVWEFLDRLIKERKEYQVQRISTGDCQCETYPTSPFKVFLEKMNDTVQQHFSTQEKGTI